MNPSSVISGATGTGTFANPAEAMGGVGGMLESPSSPKAKKMKADGKSLDITGEEGMNEVAVKAAYPGPEGEEIWDTLQEVQGVSDAFTSCGDFLQDAFLAATRDFIRNSGIQQAGRELAKALGQFDEALECASGFATLLESEGAIDDANGMGDLPQLNTRSKKLIKGITNASAASNLLAECETIRGLTSDFNNMCSELMGKINDLIGEDLAALASVLNKLAQWAAFAKLATSDPCALVNSNRMLENVTGPVMQDIMTLYAAATGQTEAPTEAPSLGDELVKPPGTIADVPKHRQAPFEGGTTVQQVSDSQPTGTGVVAAQQAESPTGGYDSTPPQYQPGVGWVTPTDPEYEGEAKSDFSKGLEKGETPFSDKNEKFTANVKDVEYKAVAEDKTKVAKVHKVGWCTGGQGGGSNRDEAGCKATDGDWHEKEMTDNEVQIAGSVEAAMGPVAKTLEDTFPEYVEGPPPSSPSSALKKKPVVTPKARDIPPSLASPAARAMVVTKDRDPLEQTGSFYGTWGYPNKVIPISPAMNDPILSKMGPAGLHSSADPNDPKPFAVPTYVQQGLGILPGTYRVTTGATLPSDTSAQKSNIGGDISEYDMSREVVERAMQTGDWSQVDTCGCQPIIAVADAKEVGTCDFTGLTFPDGYRLVDQSNYTDTLIAKVDAAELAETGEYIVGDDGLIYQSVEVVIMAKYGATIVDPFEPGKETCLKHSGRWITITGAIKGVSGGSQKADIKNAKSKQVCEDANGEWVCKKGQAGSTNAKKQIQSYGKFTNKKNVNTRSKLPTIPPFDVDKLPSLNTSNIK
tara:strand:- start:104 stop:2524 length:2421 start_codon:yes stop_codon:yes gene_type:complete